MTAASVRPVNLGPSGVRVDKTPDGVRYVQATQPLGDYPVKLTDRLEHWAIHAPDRTLYAKRTSSGEWRRITYAEARELARNIGQALINRGLSPEHPIAILSGNDLEHALLSLGAMYAGVPFAPISTGYSLVSSDFAKLRYILDLVKPGLVFAASGAKFQRALDATLPGLKQEKPAELVVTEDPLPGATRFSDLTSTHASGPPAHVTGDSIVKFLFTSGSTGMPKGVINTQRMWCSNQAMIAACLPFLTDEPPVLVDWTPWNHTFGGNHDIGVTVYYGGTMYIDAGLPTTARFEETVRNLREVSPTIYLNVPKGFELLVHHLDKDKQLRETLFRDAKIMFYAGAGLSQHIWDELYRLEVETYGERIVMLTGLGST